MQKDASAAVRFLRIAADKGDAVAMFTLGVLYQKGEGVAQDASQAVSQYRGAAEKGHTGAMVNLAQLTDKGAGVKRDSAEAAKLMLKALMGGHEGASREMTTNASAWSAEFRREFQRLLKKQGVYSGALDGKFGSGTTAAIAKLTASKPAAPSAAGQSNATPATNNAGSGKASGQDVATRPPGNEELSKLLEALPDDNPLKEFFSSLPQGAGAAAGPEASKTAATALGLRLNVLTDELRTRHGIGNGVEGVLVADVEPKSRAAERNIKRGDVIVEVGQEETRTPQDVINRISAEKAKGRKAVLVLVSDAKGDMRFLALPVQ